MKKFSLIGVLLLLLLGVVSCDTENIDNKDYTIVTGRIEYGQTPNTPRTVVVPRVVNDTGSFILRQNGNKIWLESYSIGDIITIRGKVSEGRCIICCGKFYFLDIIEILSR